MRGPPINRRELLAGSAVLAASLAVPRPARATATREFHIVAAPARLPLVGASQPKTDVWAYNGRVPGPELRVRQGERLRLLVENQLPEATTVHCHGIRLPNNMDGVPHLTQSPIEPGQSFIYEFDCPDAGTFWYHPHFNSAEQLGRGLSGALIVEEPDPIAVDRDVTWLLDDWRLRDDGSIDPNFRNLRDITHAGRIGNTVTVNGEIPENFRVHAGERVRLRLINAANARVFGLNFSGHEPAVIAIDGHPVEPHPPTGGRVVLGPGMRVDLFLELTGEPGQSYAVVDDFYSRAAYNLLDLTYSDDARRDRPSQAPVPRLPDNPLAEPDLRKAIRKQIVLGGGMMGGMTSAIVDGREIDIRSMFMRGMAWALNGLAMSEHMHDPMEMPAPMLMLERDQSYIVEIINDTAWPHPMHMHGHVFRVISRNGREEPHRPWQDTVLLQAREWVEIAFVADNPGDWMFHCHVLEHQMAGMMGVMRVR